MKSNKAEIIWVNGAEFRLVRASELSLGDGFLNYSPKTPAEKAFKENVKEVIEAGVEDFYRPTLDPSFDGDGEICYQAGMKPAVGKSYRWWMWHARVYCPELKSRLGSNFQYIAFLAVFIKEMVDSGKSLEWAWNAVCNDSKELGHYRNSSDAKHEFEATGNRKVCSWRDLGNTCKILTGAKEAAHYWLVASCYEGFSFCSPLAKLYSFSDRYYDHNSESTGWLVLS